MKLVMAIDAAKCMHCQACVMACGQRNAVPVGASRNWVRSSSKGIAFQPGGCMHCANAPCVAVCPTAATRRLEDGSVGVDKSLCIGCGNCVRACPYKARYIDRVAGVVDKCDYCADSRAEGRLPACVTICPTGVRVFGDADDPTSAVSLALSNGQKHSVVRPAQFDTQPTLTYLGNLPEANWPPEPKPGFMAAMPVVATATRWLGGLALFGVLAVFVKQLVAPSTEEPHASPNDKGKGEKA